MTALKILKGLWAGGVAVRLSPDGLNLAVPAHRLTSEQRDLVLAHKSDLLAFLTEAHNSTGKLIEAAMRRCGEFGDDEHARREMREQCRSLPPHLQIDLLEHFSGNRPTFKTGGETEERL